MKDLISFAQTQEDIVLYHALGEMKDYFWIDAGANDPVILSVTKFFSDRGGRGINIEPQICYKEEYIKQRPKDINLFIAISNKEGVMKLYGDGGLASLKGNLDFDCKTIDVPVVRLDMVCEKYIKKDQPIHFLKIDVEGSEKELLESMDFQTYRPWIIVIESFHEIGGDYAYKQWENILIDNGYVYVWEEKINRYYVLKEMKNIINRFEDMDKIKEIYNIISYSEIIWKNKQIDNLSSELNEVYSSLSWKLTKPARLLRSVFRK